MCVARIGTRKTLSLVLIIFTDLISCLQSASHCQYLDLFMKQTGQVSQVTLKPDLTFPAFMLYVEEGDGKRREPLRNT